MENKKTCVYKSKSDGMWTVKYWTKYGYAARYAKYSDWNDAIYSANLFAEERMRDGLAYA